MPDEDVVSWQDDFSVENKLIDEQHRQLVRTTNELFAACRQGGIVEKVAFMKTIHGAMNYAKTHFATEESLMRKTDYPEYAVHKREHEDFIAELMRQVKGFEDGLGITAENFVRFLMDWILNHIAKSDKKYIPYLRDQTAET